MCLQHLRPEYPSTTQNSFGSCWDCILLLPTNMVNVLGKMSARWFLEGHTDLVIPHAVLDLSGQQSQADEGTRTAPPVPQTWFRR